ncbi:hypothetical protein GCM10027449_28720 [Sinomonas notoginsengisoli]
MNTLPPLLRCPILGTGADYGEAGMPAGGEEAGEAREEQAAREVSRRPQNQEAPDGRGWPFPPFPARLLAYALGPLGRVPCLRRHEASMPSFARLVTLRMARTALAAQPHQIAGPLGPALTSLNHD